MANPNKVEAKRELEKQIKDYERRIKYLVNKATRLSEIVEEKKKEIEEKYS